MREKEKKAVTLKCAPSYSLGEEIFNATSHGVGALLSIFALIAMTLVAAGTGSPCLRVYPICALFHVYALSFAARQGEARDANL